MKEEKIIGKLNFEKDFYYQVDDYIIFNYKDIKFNGTVTDYDFIIDTSINIELQGFNYDKQTILNLIEKIEKISFGFLLFSNSGINIGFVYENDIELFEEGNIKNIKYFFNNSNNYNILKTII